MIILENEHIKSTKFNWIVLMRKYISKKMDMGDSLLHIRVNYKKQLSL